MKDEKQKLQILTLAFALAAALEPWSATGRDSGTGCNVNKGEKLDKCVYSGLRCMCNCKYKKYKYNGENYMCVYSEVSKLDMCMGNKIVKDTSRHPIHQEQLRHEQW